MSDLSITFRTLARVSGVVCLCVIILGAYVRLSDAGLGCPDWPGCYGQLVGVPDTAEEISIAEQNYQRPVEVEKAWKEMAHRYLAGGFGLLILALTVAAVINRRHPRQPLKLPLVIAALVIAQAVLGMWTVTWSLMPVIVIAHLLGGMLLLCLLWWLILRTSDVSLVVVPSGFAFALLVGSTILLGLQIMLGGWVSANYAALACPDFPTCHQQWWPPMDFKQAFSVSGGDNVNYEFGTLDSPARVAVHVAHRIGALIVAMVLGGCLLFLSFVARSAIIRKVAVAGLFLLIVQIALGISNVIFYLPLVVANAHNAVAALLLLVMVTLLYMLKSPVKPTERYA